METRLILLPTPSATQNENKIVPCFGLRGVQQEKMKVSLHYELNSEKFLKRG